MLFGLLLGGCSSSNDGGDSPSGGGDDPTATVVVAPSSLHVVPAADAHCMVLDWKDNAKDETGFEIEKKSSGTWSLIRSVGANVTKDVEDCSDIVHLGTYCYRVRAKRDTAYSSYTSEVCGVDTFNGSTAKIPPALPQNIVATVEQNSSDSIKVGWSSALNAAYYKVYRNTVDDFASATVTATVDATHLTLLDSGLNACTIYYYWVAAYNDKGHAVDSNSSVTATTAPAAPGNFRAYKGPGVFSVHLTWDAETCASKYYVYFLSSYNDSYALLTPDPGISDAWLTVTDVPEDIYYFFRVQSVDIDGNFGALSCRVVSTAPQAGATSQLDECMAAVAWAADADAEMRWGSHNNYSDKVEIGWNSVPLTWNSEGVSTSYATEYELNVSTDGVTWTALSNQTHANDNTPVTYTYNAAANTLYRFRIATHYHYDLNHDGIIDLVRSNPWMDVNASTASAPATIISTLPKTWLTADAYYANAIHMGWGSVSGATKYYIYRATSRNGTYGQVGVVNAPTNTFTHDPVTPYTDYWYKVRAYNSAGLGEWSDAVYASATNLNWSH